MVAVSEGVLRDIISVLQNIIMVCGVFCVPITKNRKTILCGGVFLAGICFGDIWFGYSSLVMMILRVALNPVIIFFWTEGKVIRRFFIYICSIIYLHLVYLCIDFLASVVSGQSMAIVGTFAGYRIIRAIITVVVAGGLTLELWKISGYHNTLQHLPTRYFLTVSICCLAASVVQHYIEDVSKVVYGNLDQMIFITGCMVIVSGMFYALGVGVVVLDILRKKYQEESRLKDEYLQITREYVRMVKENARETRKMRHDLQAHVGSLWHYMEEEKYDKARFYLSDLRSHTDKIFKKTLSVNHEIVDALLLEAQIRSERLQVQWSLDGYIPPELPVTDFDLCTIFSNILANSLEACEKLCPEQRTIHLEIRHYANYLIIELENPTECSVETEMLGSITSKRDVENHGYGIANVRSVVERNGGEISFKNRDRIFCVRILLPFEK